MILDDELDLSDDIPTSDSDGEESEDEKQQDTREEDQWVWNWKSHGSPAPAFEIDYTNEGRPASLPANAKNWTPTDFFFTMFPKRVFQLATEETNRYASEHNVSYQGQGNRKWRLVTEVEIYKFVAILLMMGVLRARDLRTLWARTSPSVVKLPSCAHVMAEHRWREIKRFFHLVDNSKAPPSSSPQYDPLYKVKSVYQCLQERFRMHWKIGQFVSLDESMTGYKGRSRFKQYIRSKPTPWGFKFFCLCDPVSGYFKEFLLYTGKQTVEEKHGLCTDVVLHLIQKSQLEKTNCILVADNYYTSPLLAGLLAAKGVGFIGTCQLTRRHVPSQQLRFSERPGAIVRGTHKALVATLTNVSESLPELPVYCLSWCDTRIANFLATAAGLAPTTVTRRRRNGTEVEVPAPMIVKTYTKTMGGVDRADQNKSRFSVSATVRTRKWWFRIFSGLLDMAITNAWQLYRFSVNRDQRLNHQQFILEVCDGLLACQNERSPIAENLRSDIAGSHRLVKQELLSRCVICSSKKSPARTIWMCSICQYAMCAEECFYEFHDGRYTIKTNFQKRKKRTGNSD